MASGRRGSAGETARGGLSSADRQALQALLALGADAPSRRQPWAMVAYAAGLGRDGNLMKRIAASLRRRRLIQTKTGPHGGVWLTPRGRRIAASTTE